MADTTPDTRPVDREYLDARLDRLGDAVKAVDERIELRFQAVEDRFDRKLAELETRLGRQFLGMFVPLIVAILGTLVAVLLK